MQVIHPHTKALVVKEKGELSSLKQPLGSPTVSYTFALGLQTSCKSCKIVDYVKKDIFIRSCHLY